MACDYCGGAAQTLAATRHTTPRQRTLLRMLRDLLP